jgi:hypothetical protein
VRVWLLSQRANNELAPTQSDILRTLVAKSMAPLFFLTSRKGISAPAPKSTLSSFHARPVDDLVHVHVVRLLDCVLDGAADGVRLDRHLAVGFHPFARGLVADGVGKFDSTTPG